MFITSIIIIIITSIIIYNTCRLAGVCMLPSRRMK